MIQPSRLSVSFENSVNLLSLLKQNKVSIDNSCGGNGTCGTCLVKVIATEKKLESRNELENEMANDRGFSDSERLSCQLEICASLEIQIPLTSRKRD